MMAAFMQAVGMPTEDIQMETQSTTAYERIDLSMILPALEFQSAMAHTEAQVRRRRIGGVAA